MSERQPNYRQKWLSNEGYAHSVLVGHEVNNEIPHLIHPVALTVEQGKHFYLNDTETDGNPIAIAALCLQFGSTFRERTFNGYMAKFQTIRQDESLHAFTYAGGLGDQEFTWRFSPVVANTVLDVFIEKGMITKDEKLLMTIGDWANLIGSGWFSELMHDLALTKNGVYQKLGEYMKDYSLGAFRALLDEVAKRKFGEMEVPTTPELFDVAVVREEGLGDGRIIDYVTGFVSPQLRTLLRKFMHKHTSSGLEGLPSPGCPIARHVTTLTPDVVANDKDLHTLVQAGILEAIGTSDKGTRYRQEITPIDTSLQQLAIKLDEYERLYGTPHVTLDEFNKWQEVTHTRREPTNVLIREIET